jgi:ABC-type lipoprotein release transport system permease subunit
VSYSAVDETVGAELEAMPEVAQVTGMLQGLVDAEDNPIFLVYAYPEDSFILDRFQIIAGQGLGERVPAGMRGTPVLLGSAAAEAMHKSPGDTMRISSGVFRVIGIYQTGDAFEDSGAVLGLRDAQELLGKHTR